MMFIKEGSLQTYFSLISKDLKKHYAYAYNTYAYEYVKAEEIRREDVFQVYVFHLGQLPELKTEIE